jgi:hypothetical protein
MKIVLPLLSLLVFALTGCVMIDSRAVGTRSHARELKDFAGSYTNIASYRSESLLGLQNTSRLDELLERRERRDGNGTVEITVCDSNVFAAVIIGGETAITHRYVLGKDFQYKDGTIAFPRHYEAEPGHDSPTFGFIGTGRQRLMLDERGNLVVLANGAALGSLAIFPVAFYTHWMSVFPRTETPLVK